MEPSCLEQPKDKALSPSVTEVNIAVNGLTISNMVKAAGLALLWESIIKVDSSSTNGMVKR